MNILFIVFLIIYFILIFAFLFIFVKSDYDINKTMKIIFRKKEKTENKVEVTDVRNRENTTKKIIGESCFDEEIEEDNLEIEEKQEEDCDKAGGLILNICESKDYTEEEQLLRKRILEKLRKNPTYFEEDGINKLIVPLEVMVFLNNDLNPIVSENGEIVLTLNTTENKDFIIKDKSKADTIKNEVEEEYIDEIEDNTKTVEKTKIKEVKKEEIKKEEIKKEEIIEDIGDDLIDDLDDLGDTKIENIEDSMLEDLDKMITEEESKENKKDNTIEEDEDISIKEFLQNRKWKEGENMIIDWKQIKDIILNTFENKENLNAFLSNIIKQKPLISNDNKTAIFVDLKIINRAFSELYGPDSDSLIKKLSRMPNKLSESYQVGLELSLSDYISDLVNENKRITSAYFIKDGKSFKGYGLWLKMESFKTVLNEKDFDLFRRHIYNEGLQVSVQSNNSSPLILDINGTAI